MKIYEKLFLLALDDEKAIVHASAEGQLGFGLAGAILSELVLAGRLGLDEHKKLSVLDPHPLDDDLLDEVLGRMDESDRRHRASFWVCKLAEGVKKLRRRVGQKLVDASVLSVVRKHYLWVIPYQAYPQVDTSAKYWVKQQLRQMVLIHAEARPEEISLLGLLRACDMLGLVFTQDELKSARASIDRLTLGDEIGRGVKEAIEAIEAAAIMAALSVNPG